MQIRPWKLSDSDYIMDHTQPIDPRKTIFIGGVPRPLKACELADIFNSRYGNVCYAGIDCDPELKYPKGVCEREREREREREGEGGRECVCVCIHLAVHYYDVKSLFAIFLISSLLWPIFLGAGRVTFSSRVSFMSAVSCRFLQVTYGDIDKKVSSCGTNQVPGAFPVAK